MTCQSQEVGVGHLLMSLQLAGNGLERIRNGKILDPEFVVRMSQVGGK